MAVVSTNAKGEVVKPASKSGAKSESSQDKK